MFLAALLMIAALAQGEPVTETPCDRVYQSVVKHYKALYHRLGTAVPAPSALTKIIAINQTDCSNPASAQAALIVMNEALSKHSGKIGVILPMTEPERARSEAIISGIRAAFSQPKAEFERQVIVIDSKGEIRDLVRALSELLFNQNVALVIGGSTQIEARALAAWGERLMIPMLLVSPLPAHLSSSRTSFHVFPTEGAMAAKLASYIKQKSYKNVALLRPNRHSKSQLPTLLREELTRLRINVGQDALYEPANQASIEAVLKSLLRINDPNRAPEFEALYKEKKEEAAREHQTFNPRIIQLPPKVEFDALVVLDNFRMVRHVVNAIKYFGVKKLALIGNQEWRARGLFEPQEPFLKGAVFADIMGSYRELPPNLAPAADHDSPYLAAAKDMSLLDYRLVGYRAMSLALNVANDLGIPRRKLAEQLAQLEIPATKAFPTVRVFDEQAASNWPVFLFRVDDKGFTPISSVP